MTTIAHASRGAQVRATPQFEVPSGLPELIQELGRLIRDPDVSFTLSPVFMESGQLLARIPIMIEEIGRLRDECDIARESAKMLTSALLAKEGENFDNATAEIGRLRTLNAELQTAWHDAECGRDRLRTALLKYGHHLGHCEAMKDGTECTCGFKEALGQ